MNLKIADNDVVATGTCVVLGGQSLKFEFNKDFKVEIIFADDDSKKQKMEWQVIENVLFIRLYNFNNMLGTTNSEPLSLGIMDGRALKLNFAIYRIGDDKSYSRVFTYTFFCSK